MTDPTPTEVEPTPVRTRRRTFGPVVLLGLVAAGVTAIAATKDWATGSTGSGSTVSTQAADALGVATGDVPAANALALVCLACWGVVLVTRGRWRRAVAVLGLLAAIGTLVAVIAGYHDVVGTVRDGLVQVGGTSVTVTRSAWGVVAVVGVLLDLVAAGLALAWAPQWPEMGRKYDAPVTPGEPVVTLEVGEVESIDLWKAMDAGLDPTEQAPVDGADPR